MAHFAQLDNTNKVINVIVIDNSILNNDGIEDEQLGISYCKSLFGEDTNWIQTSYNSNFRGKFAGIGEVYDPINDIFLPNTSGLFVENTPIPE